MNKQLNLSSAHRTIAWIGGTDGFIRLLDQTLLPTEVQYRDCRTVEEIWEAIRTLRVRGAPAIGVAAAMGMVVGMQKLPAQNGDAFKKRLGEVSEYLRTSRPTAVNLFWALDRMEARVLPHIREAAVDRDSVADSRCSPRSGGLRSSVDELRQIMLAEALAIEEEDRRMCRAIGAVGAKLIGTNQGVLTHCNAGGLATADYGTALAVMFTAAEQGTNFHVFADETRPLLQGARLTTWELQQHGIDVTLICDNMAAQVMKEKRIDLVITGADRIAANGDTANKIGTYGVALLAKSHGIPFYVAAPSSTFDLKLANGDAIPIEQRDSREVTHGLGKQIAPDGVKVYNPAFDVTPAHLIAAIITEKGLVRPVNEDSIRKIIKT